MPHDHDVLDPEVEDGELDRGTHAMEAAARFVRRHEVRDIAYDEQFARHGREDGLGIDPAVAARNQHDLGFLPEPRKLFVIVRQMIEVAMLEAAKAIGELIGEKPDISGPSRWSRWSDVKLLLHGTCDFKGWRRRRSGRIFVVSPSPCPASH